MFDSFDWTRLNGPTSSSSTGPQFDHTSQTTGKGYFAYIECTSQTLNDFAVLQSAVSPSTRGSCLKFWFVSIKVKPNKY